MKTSPRTYLKHMILVIVTALLLTAQFAQFTAANAQLAASAPTTGNSMVANCDQYPGLTNRIVKCVRTTLNNADDKFFRDFYPLIARFVTAVITLGVIIYGVMMAMGMVENIGRDSIVLLIKVACVAYFVQNTDLLYDWITQSMDGLAASMFSFSTLNHPTASVCMVGKVTVWDRLDCLVDTMFGIRTDGGTASAASSGASAASNVRISGHGLARGLVAFFGSALISSVPGFIIGIIGFMFLWTMLFFLVKVLFTFLLSYMAILFLMIIGPLFMPMVIFKTTKQYFDNWVRLIVSFALQPVIIVAFVSFAVAAVDVTVFSGDMSFVRKIAGNAAKQNPFNLNQYIESKGGYITRVVGPTNKATDSRNDVQGTTTVRSGYGNLTESECGLNKGNLANSLTKGGSAFLKGAQECAEGWVVGFNFHSIDWDKLAKARQPAVQLDSSVQDDTQEKALMRELFASAILTAVMVFIINALMRVVPQIANDLVGSYRQTPNVFGTASRFSRDGGSSAAQRFMQQMRGGANRGGG